MTLLIVGGDSVESISKQAARAGLRHTEHWSGRKTRDLGKRIPKGTDAVVVVLDRINHALAGKVRAEATRRGLPVFFQKRRQVRSDDRCPLDLRELLNHHRRSR